MNLASLFPCIRLMKPFFNDILICASRLMHSVPQMSSLCCTQVYLAYCADVDADVAIKMVKLDDKSIHLVRAPAGSICGKNPTLDPKHLKLGTADSWNQLCVLGLPGP